MFNELKGNRQWSPDINRDLRSAQQGDGWISAVHQRRVSGNKVGIGQIKAICVVDQNRPRVSISWGGQAGEDAGTR